MRTTLTIIFLLIFHSSFSQGVIGWLAPYPVASKVYGNLHPRITLDKNYDPMVVWGDENGKVWFTKWGGESFAEPKVLTLPGTVAFTSSWAGPDIASRGDTVYVVYKEMPEEDHRIFVKHSYDGGKNFSIAIEADSPGRSTTRYPTISVDEFGDPFVTYMKVNKDFGGATYYVARSEDMGETFRKETEGSQMSGGRVCECSPAELVVTGNAGVLLYRNNQNNLRNVWGAVSNNGCQSFTNGIRIDSEEYIPATCPGSGPHGVIVGDTLYSVYMSGPEEGGLVYLSRLCLSSPYLTTAPVTGRLPGIVMQNFPRISGRGKAAAMVWTQTLAGNNNLCLSLTDDLSNGFPAKYDTVSNGVITNADVAIGGGSIYVIWQDELTKCVMFKKGMYIKKSTFTDNTSIIITTNKKNKYFTVSLPGLVSADATGADNRRTELDITYGQNKKVANISTEELDPGTYAIRLYDADGKLFNAQVIVK